MSISLWVGNKSYEIGSASFLKSFFSTIYIKLEDSDWGIHYPVIMDEFYMGKLSYQNCDAAITEILKIRDAFSRLSPDNIVWDFENKNSMPPWKDNISDSITSMANYFCTSDGKDLFEVFLLAFKEAKKERCDVIIK